MEQNFEDTIAALEEKLKNIRTIISDERKKGNYMTLIEVKLKNFGPKIKMAKATGKDKDVIAAKEILDEAEREIEEAKKEGLTESRFDIHKINNQINEELNKDLRKESGDKVNEHESVVLLVDKINELINKNQIEEPEIQACLQPQSAVRCSRTIPGGQGRQKQAG